MSSTSSFIEKSQSERMLANFRLAISPVIELYQGVRSNTVPWANCTGFAVLMALVVNFGWDLYLFKQFDILFLYPRHGVLFAVYVSMALTSGFWGWAFFKAGRRNKFARQLEMALITAGLKNRLGKIPKLISDVSLDEFTRKLRLTTANFPKPQFEAAKPALETGLRVYIDEVRENRAYGCVDLIYSYFSMPSLVEMGDISQLRVNQFKIGKTRSKDVVGSLKETPHLLVAGQTGGGKSTFLRQFITTLYLRNNAMSFVLIDLKGGLEFQVFEGLSRVNVMPSIAQAINELKRIERNVSSRMQMLKEYKCKDIDALNSVASGSKDRKGGKQRPNKLGRLLLVVDEATEMFLAGNHASAAEIQKARRILSQVARQGRAVGVHLVIATQRPDARALDPQVKANLTGVMCFPMANDASSMTVLGNGRATDLPAIAGRAVWKSGIEMIEVQTPYLSAEETEKLLGPLRNSDSSASASTSLLNMIEDENVEEMPSPPVQAWLE